MRLFLLIILLSASQFLFSQRNGFGYSDTSFNIGDIHRIEIEYSFKLPLIDDNKLVYDSIKIFLETHPNLVVEIACHTDQRGTDTYNLKLSERKAQSVLSELLKMGVNSKQVSAKGYGESKPIITEEEIDKMSKQDEKEIAFSKNRRLELVILEIK